MPRITPFVTRSRTRRSTLQILSTLSLVGAVSGCGVGSQVVGLFTSEPEATTVDMRVDAAPGLNPDIKGRPSPIWMRVYQLRSAGVFRSAQFKPLFEKDSRVLGAEMLARKEFVLTPDESMSLNEPMDMHEDAHFIGVIAAFRDINRAKWRDLVEVKPKGQELTLNVKLDRLALRLERDDG
jgi:type VI secretion system protein VasD